MAKAKNLQWGSANRPKVSNKLGIPIPVEGSDGDIQIRQTNAGPKLFAKLGGVWNNTFLSKESDVLSIRDNKGVSRISLSATGDADFHGTLKITGYGGMIDFQGGQGNVLLGDSRGKPLANLVNSTTNDDNFAMGSYSMNSTINARQNICLGYGTMQYIGRSSSEPYGDNSYNVAIGLQALAGRAGGTRTQATRNVAIGLLAMGQAHYDDSASSTTYNNVAIGFKAGYFISGYSNVLIGDNAGYGATTTTGYANVAIGDIALKDYTTGYNNIAIGYRALQDTTEGNSNVGIGFAAGKSTSTGHHNTFVGSSAGDDLEDGNYNTYIGFNASVSASDVASEIVIAATNSALAGAGTETCRIGLSSDYITNDFGENATWTHSSDIRIKKDIENNNLGLAFINDLRTVTFKKKTASEYPEEFESHDENQTERTKPDFINYGFIAQEVKESMDKVGHSEFPVWNENRDGMQMLGETELITPLTKAIQELSAKIDAMQIEINNLK